MVSGPRSVRRNGTRDGSAETHHALMRPVNQASYNATATGTSNFMQCQGWVLRLVLRHKAPAINASATAKRASAIGLSRA